MSTTKRETRGRQENILLKLKEASEDIKDSSPFWSNILLQCSKNKFPKEGFNFYNGVLSYGKSSRRQEVALIGSSREIAKTCIEFFQKHGSIYSPNDREHLRQESMAFREQQLAESKDKVDNWGHIRSLQEKKVYVKSYIRDLYSNRPDYVRIRLLNQIMVGLNSGQLKRTDIIMKDGKIVEILNFHEIEPNVFKYSAANMT